MSKIIEFSLSALCAFLHQAKTSAFAGNGPRTKRLNIRIYRYEVYPWEYEDGYVGNIVDSGLELVRLKTYPVWAMSYHGGMLEGKYDLSGEAFRFLKEALQRTSHVMPVRGPKFYRQGDWKYSNHINGTLLDFVGSEEIAFQKGQVYTRNYCGGLVIDKDYRLHIEP